MYVVTVTFVMDFCVVVKWFIIGELLWCLFKLHFQCITSCIMYYCFLSSEELRFNVRELPRAHEMALWTWKWACCRKTPINLRVVAMAASEQIFTSIPLAAITVFEQNNILTRLRQSMELIIKDKVYFLIIVICQLFTFFHCLCYDFRCHIFVLPLWFVIIDYKSS